VLVLGGQRSGKSRFAERLVAASGLNRSYIATAEARDGEMADRIALHRARRGSEWGLIEEPLDLPGAISRTSSADTATLVDCLTLWLSNLLGAGRSIGPATEGLLAALGDAPGPVVIVTNEVGSGIVPGDRLSRDYADALGTLNQKVAEAVPSVVLMAAGIPLTIKPAKEFAA
jgi:adenosylcobinamide kinase / adenosylcobinamide-phosphate guanylyltransferase